MSDTINRRDKSLPSADNPPRVKPSDIVAALEGHNPRRDKPMSAGRLGDLLAPFRKSGQYAGEPFSRQAIQGMAHPEKYTRKDGTAMYPVSADFAWAFWAWRESENSGGIVHAIGIDGLSLEEIIGEAGVAHWVGEGNPQRVVVVGEIPEGAVIHLNGGASLLSTDGLAIRECPGCGVKFLGNGRKTFHSAECRIEYRKKAKRETSSAGTPKVS